MKQKEPREIIAAHKHIVALDILADDLRDMKERIEKTAQLTCLNSGVGTDTITKINTLHLDYEIGREIRKELMTYFKLKDTTTDEEIAQMLTGLLDLVKLQVYVHKHNLGRRRMMISNARYYLEWYSIHMQLYCHIKTMEPDDLTKELGREVG